MNLLLDSNIVLPLTRRELKKLSPKIVALLETFEGVVYVSAASLWEIAIKTRLRKLDPLVPLADIPDYVEGLGFGLMDITPRHAIEELRQVPDTRDPFDRLLLAQCQVENLRLVTVDPKLLPHPLAWRGA
jgi:PIN domain nuclease of toxin-antitoxin system